MDKSFEEIISESLADLQSEIDSTNTEVNESVEPEEVDEVASDSTEEDEDSENIEESVSDEDDNVDDQEAEEEEPQNQGVETKDHEAFARMRKENKEYKDKVAFFDEQAKLMGMSGIDELIQKTNEAQIAKEAKAQGIPLEVAKKLNELEEKVKEGELREQERERAFEDARINNTLDRFVQTNKLDDKAVNKLASDLLNDGITLDTLKNLPENTVNRMLSSYLPKELAKQKELEKKEQIKKELPPDTKNASKTETQDEKLDELAKLWAGK